MNRNSSKLIWDITILIARNFCTKNRGKVIEKISMLLDAMNREVLGYLNLKFENREEYAINYVS